ncbi:SDR family oxidoreductase [Saliniramus sp.]|uniref:SDR family oxidoreductase n=1 Tax=Saliniramus sp. TaxID=2986772 RepID=UPI002CB571C5|nr:SDR family oxidoreductase [Saliniramus sp.]HMB10474.1 SDR family oxidoreductase [Saliniramus sp.]
MIKAIVTGHSRGLGAGMAQALLMRDVRVLGVSRRPNAALAERFSQDLQEVTLDLSDAQAARSWLAGAEMRDFLADAQTAILINNAGIVQPIGPSGALDIATIAQAVTLNIAGPLMAANAFIAATEKVADRRIMHISSGAGRRPMPGWSIYCATKAALDHHARSVAADTVPHLAIESLAPGVIDTDMQGEIRATTPEQFTLREQFVALKQNNDLSSPESCGEAIVAHLLGPRFGAEVITDIRQIG